MATRQRETEKKGTTSTSTDTSQARETSGARSTAATKTDRERPIPVSGEAQRSRSGSSLLRGVIPMSPWDLMRRMSEELDQLVQSVGIARPGGTSPAQAGTTSPAADLTAWVPRIEVQQRPHAITVRADLPGLKPEEVDVSVDDGMLTIRGERRQERKEEDDGFVRSEVVYGTFFRTLPLPEGADEERVSATFRDGVLEITVPVQAREHGRRIPVQSQSQAAG